MPVGNCEIMKVHAKKIFIPGTAVYGTYITDINSVIGL